MAESVAVIGAGLVGCLTALGFAHKGFNVTLYDLRSDPRNDKNRITGQRSINLAVSERGIQAMKYVDPEMSDRILKNIIPMHGRMIHDLEGNQESQIYGLFGESINSIDRTYLNTQLLDEVDSFNRNNSEIKISLKFNHKLLKIEDKPTGISAVFNETNSENGEQSTVNEKFDFIVGCDGAFSAVRSNLQKFIRMSFSQEYIDTCYVELYIPPGVNNSYMISPNHLHIWPRHKYMLIALANPDGSFTSTFFAPWKLAESLDTPEKIGEFFTNNFKDAVEMMGLENLISMYLENPKGSLMQVDCDQYHYQDKLIILGDAAHAMVPFYGQGMNCGFEDVRILLNLLEKHEFKRASAFQEYSQTRHKDLQAILKLAIDNYYEMSHKVTSSLYIFRKSLDSLLGRFLPKYWIPLYTMVSFRSDIPYSKAITIEKRQSKILKNTEFTLLSLAGIGLARYLSKKLR